jgi:hypothetical protein
MIRKSIKIELAFCMAFLILGVLFSSVVYILNNSHHVCSGKDCAVCAELQLAEAALNQMSSAILFYPVLFALAFIYAGSKSIVDPVYLIHTPVHMKVRLND